MPLNSTKLASPGVSEIGPRPKLNHCIYNALNGPQIELSLSFRKLQRREQSRRYARIINNIDSIRSMQQGYIYIYIYIRYQVSVTVCRLLIGVDEHLINANHIRWYMFFHLTGTKARSRRNLTYKQQAGKTSRGLRNGSHETATIIW